MTDSVESGPVGGEPEQAPTVREALEAAAAELEGAESEAEEEQEDLEEETSEEEEADEPDDDGESEEVEQADPPIPTPVSLSADAKAEFESLPREAQQIVAKRVQDLERGFHQDRQESAEMRRALEPYEQRFKMQGTTPAQVVQRLLAVGDYIDQNPRKHLIEVIASYGLTPQDLLQEAGKGNGVTPEVMQLKQQVAAMQAQQSQREQEAQQHELNSLSQEIVAFAQETDKDGTPLRPFFEQIIPDLQHTIRLVRNQHPTWGNRQVLQEAYDRGVRANPSTWAELEKSRAAEAEAKRLAESKAKVAKAKRASVSVTGAPDGGATKGKPSTLRGQIQAAFAGEL